MKRFHKAGLLFLLLMIPVLSVAQAELTFRISVENTETHVQTKAVRLFAEVLAAEFPGRLDVRFFHSAQLFRDSEVVRALTRGDVEMAVPGTWQLDRYVPEIGYLLMPDFFGADSSDIDLFFDNGGGREIIRRIEKNLDVKVPGLWMDLGAAHIFTIEDKIDDFSDFQGLRIRVAGGIANKKRVEILGAEGVIIPWPDLQLRIRDGSIDGILTTFETVRSAELWESGIHYAFTDSEYYAQYVPIISAYLWNQLSDEERIRFSAVWNEVAVQQRIEAAKAQQDAMAAADRNGVIITRPDSRQMEDAKRLLKKHEDEILDNLRIQPEVIRILRDE